MRTVAVLALLTAFSAYGQRSFKPLDETQYPRLVAGYKGKVLLVDFWAAWCVPCRAELPQMVKLQAKLKAKGLEVVTVSADEPETAAAAEKFLKDSGAMSLPAYLKRPKDDDKFISMVDPKWVGALPAVFLYDKAGNRAHSFFGETPIRTIEDAAVKLLAQP